MTSGNRKRVPGGASVGGGGGGGAGGPGGGGGGGGATVLAGSSSSSSNSSSDQSILDLSIVTRFSVIVMLAFPSASTGLSSLRTPLHLVGASSSSSHSQSSFSSHSPSSGT